MSPLSSPGGAVDRLAGLGRALQAEGRFADAETVFGHLAELRPDDLETQRGLIAAIGAQGRTLEAMERMVAARGLQTDTAALLADIQAQSAPAIEKYNAHLAAGEVDQAEPYAAALAALAPQSAAMLAAALACNLALNRPDQITRYAEALLKVEPDNPAARGALAGLGQATAEGEIALRIEQALTAELHPLIRLRDLHDAASLILCRPLTPDSEAQLETLVAAARALAVDVEPGSEWEGWAVHYRLLMEAIDLEAVRAPTPEAAQEPDVAFATSTGEPTDWAGVRATAARMGARCVFFAAADEAYVDLYARWYALSVLKYADVPSLVVIHVIGGADRLAQIAARVGVIDERLVFAGDRFDADAVTTQVFDAPPKGLIVKPVAHFQSVRFLRLGALLAQLGRPVFVSDIDLLLQRGVEDLLARAAGDDVMFNENELSQNAGSRLTANLLLVNPTPNAALFLRFLGHFLETALARPRVTRWIDQVGLIFARHHLVRHGQAPAIGYFDTAADINNVMYPSYQAHPFRFLSLFHGFDTSSLEGDPRVLGEGTS
jgi:tetratricopeptide (TPR) repeat protein